MVVKLIVEKRVRERVVVAAGAPSGWRPYRILSAASESAGRGKLVFVDILGQVNTNFCFFSAGLRI